MSRSVRRTLAAGVLAAAVLSPAAAGAAQAATPSAATTATAAVATGSTTPEPNTWYGPLGPAAGPETGMADMPIPVCEPWLVPAWLFQDQITYHVGDLKTYIRNVIKKPWLAFTPQQILNYFKYPTTVVFNHLVATVKWGCFTDANHDGVPDSMPPMKGMNDMSAMGGTKAVAAGTTSTRSYGGGMGATGNIGTGTK